jgi:osmotically-inducible protein OsmY
MTCDIAMPEPSGEAETSQPLTEAARQALDGTGRDWLRRVCVSTVGGAVRLEGTVPSYYLKQMAQEVVMTVPGVEVVRNELRVERGLE